MDRKLLRLYQPLNAYSYNSDSLFLYDFSRPFIKNSGAILDIGSGCGVLGLLCARDNPLAIVHLVEKDSKMAFCSQKNALKFPNAQVFESDFLDFTPPILYDAIVCNPPFYALGSIKSKNKGHARHQSELDFASLVVKVKKCLKPKGYFIFCYEALSLCLVIESLKSAKLTLETLRFVQSFKDKNAHLMLGLARNNSKSVLKVLPPLITHNSKNQSDNTKEVLSIYQICNTYSIKAFLN
ncbi:tRNA1(Val) (adenine(37)-N6)-methyltransferase [Helicobacter pylori]|uniref:tRNA1(Val) (adenine(37)-N6)-methyltransferase n=1 Tax=Helicobacter pylori TaxID=210 RepID=UPI001FD4293C|nr:tRNA1(Val) (adenine(37)-N6)-methyltransferase [Helicobacter pylori]UOR69321.1 tRNA1(Val) (adenine(37)-N6)-methyltransferase [Helicobacter pylori]